MNTPNISNQNEGEGELGGVAEIPCVSPSLDKLGEFELNKVYCIEKKVDMSDVLEKLIENELKRGKKNDKWK